MENKRKLGQYFTTENPFKHDAFMEWVNLIPDFKNKVLLEPFSGANNIIYSMKEIGIKNDWKAYDIAPPRQTVVESVPVIKNDSIKNFPKGYEIVITNPPYLAKNSATFRGLEYPKTEYDDLYKLSLSVMLNNVDYIAAIIPESFITANLFHNRLYSVISLNTKMFDDTEHPVCLALFVPYETEDFKIYNIDGFINNYSKIKDNLFKSKIKHNWKFNDPSGNIGVYCVDSPSGDRARFVIGDEIDSRLIKPSSRAITRISGLPEDIELKPFINELNQKLSIFREETGDVLLTAFKGLRKDGHFRRRLDYKTIRLLLNETLEKGFTPSDNK